MKNMDVPAPIDTSNIVLTPPRYPNGMSPMLLRKLLLRMGADSCSIIPLPGEGPAHQGTDTPWQRADEPNG